jgi:hypothetical protein
LFDPVLHTVEYVRSTCPFLFTCLIMAGCKFWKPHLYPACQQLAHDTCVKVFQHSVKSVGVVQAFACMTYWKEPDDNVCPSVPFASLHASPSSHPHFWLVACITDAISFIRSLGTPIIGSRSNKRMGPAVSSEKRRNVSPHNIYRKNLKQNRTYGCTSGTLAEWPWNLA